jgi:hypothetical protein
MVNVPSRPKCSKALLLSYIFKCPLKKMQSFCPCSRALNRSAKGLKLEQNRIKPELYGVLDIVMHIKTKCPPLHLVLYQSFIGYWKQFVRQHLDTVNICIKQEVRSGCLYLFCISESNCPWSGLRPIRYRKKSIKHNKGDLLLHKATSFDPTVGSSSGDYIRIKEMKSTWKKPTFLPSDILVGI